MQLKDGHSNLHEPLYTDAYFSRLIRWISLDFCFFFIAAFSSSKPVIWQWSWWSFTPLTVNLWSCGCASGNTGPKTPRATPGAVTQYLKRSAKMDGGSRCLGGTTVPLFSFFQKTYTKTSGDPGDLGVKDLNPQNSFNEKLIWNKESSGDSCCFLFTVWNSPRETPVDTYMFQIPGKWLHAFQLDELLKLGWCDNSLNFFFGTYPQISLSW